MMAMLQYSQMTCSQQTVQFKNSPVNNLSFLTILKELQDSGRRNINSDCFVLVCYKTCITSWTVVQAVVKATSQSNVEGRFSIVIHLVCCSDDGSATDDVQSADSPVQKLTSQLLQYFG